MAEIVGLAVALVLVVPQFVVKLQVSTLPEGFAVGGNQHVAAVVGGRGVIACGIVGGVLPCTVLHAVEMYLVVADVLVLVFADAAFDTYDDVTAFRVQAAVELQHDPGVFVEAVAHVGLEVAVDDVGVKW